MTPARSTGALTATGLTKSFAGRPVLRDVTLHAPPGACLVIIGPSGCGKSTLLRCLNLLETPDSGSITLDALTVAPPWNRASARAAHALRAHIGMVFQGFHLFAHRTVIDNVMLAPRIVRRLPPDAARAEAEALLAKVGLATLADRRPETLSGGQQQRAAIARALAMRPQVMLYDEPTSALDPELKHEVLQVMRALDTEGMTQIVVTHEMAFARSIADRVLFMHEGAIVEHGPPDQLFGNAADPRTQRFVARIA